MALNGGQQHWLPPMATQWHNAGLISADLHSLASAASLHTSNAASAQQQQQRNVQHDHLVGSCAPACYLLLPCVVACIYLGIDPSQSPLLL